MTATTVSKLPTLILAKRAGLIAKNYYDDIASGNHRLTLEEIELVERGKYWLITLGIYTPTDALMLLSQGIKEAVNYKTFKIRRTTGEVISMKMRPYPLANTAK